VQANVIFKSLAKNMYEKKKNNNKKNNNNMSGSFLVYLSHTSTYNFQSRTEHLNWILVVKSVLGFGKVN